MATASQRYFSFDLGKGDKEHLGVTFSVTFQIYVLIAFVIVIFAETLGLWFVNTKLVIPTERMVAANWIFQAAVVSFLLTLITTPYMASIIAHENISVYAYVSIVEVFLKLGIVFLLRILPYDKLVVYGFLLTAVALINTSIYRFYCKAHYAECKARLIKDRALFKEIVSYSGWNLFGAAVGVVKNQIINILLNMNFGAIVNAARGISAQVNSAVVSFSQNFSTALRPQIIKTYAAGKKDDAMSLVFRGCKFTFCLMYIFALPLCLEMKTILGLWLKNPPDYAVGFTQLALIDAVVDSISYPLMTLAQATGRIKMYQGVVGGILLCNFPISYVALKLGASVYAVMLVAICITFVAFLVRLLIVKMLADFSILRFFLVSAIPCLLVVLCSAIIPVFFILHFNEGVIRLCLTVLISVLSTMVCVLFVGMNNAEREGIIATVKARFGGGK